jgi:hypothetical protein
VRKTPSPVTRWPVTPTPGADLVLAGLYREWFVLCAQEVARGPGSLWEPEKPWQHYVTLDLDAPPPPGPAQARTAVADLLAEIRAAQRLCSNPDLVYEITKGVWWTETGREP